MSTFVADIGSYNIRWGESGASVPSTIVRSKCPDGDLLANATYIERMDDLLDLLEGLDKKPFETSNLFVTCKKDYIQNSFRNNRTWAETLFEKWGLACVGMMTAGVCQALAHGLTQAVVVDSGYFTVVSGHYEDGYCFHPKYSSVNLGGRSCTLRLQKLLAARGWTVSEEIASEIKEEFSSVSRTSSEDVADARVKNLYKLPDGNIIELGGYPQLACEVCFDPCANGESIRVPAWRRRNRVEENYSIGGQIFSTVGRNDSNWTIYFNDRYKNIVFTGGNSKLPGFVGRTIESYRNYISTNSLRKVSDVDRLEYYHSSNRSLDAWNGLQVISAIPIVDATNRLSGLLTKEVYDERGPDATRTCWWM